MTTKQVSPERLAMLIHHYREALAPDFGCDSEGAHEWSTLSRRERSRMVAAARLALLDLESGECEAGAATALAWQQGTEGKECGC